MSSVSAISSSNIYLPNQQEGIEKDYQALQKALNSGNLAAAQQAFAALQQELSNISQAQTVQQSSQTDLQNDLQAIDKALNSGDLAGAKKALASLQRDAQHIRHGHHHHRPAQNAQSAQSNTDLLGGSNSTVVSTVAQDATGLLGDADGDDAMQTGASINVTA